MPKKLVFNPLSGNLDVISEVALTSVGSTPNANGASIDANQNLNLQPADATHPGVISTGTQSIAGAKTLLDDTTVDADLTVTGNTTLNTGLTGPLKAAAGVVSAAPINLTSEVTGVLPIAKGGTNSSTALANDRVIVSSGGKLVEVAGLGDGQILIGATGLPPVPGNIQVGSGLDINNGTNAIIISLEVPPSTGDIPETTFSITNNQSSAANVTLFAFANATVRAFEALVTVEIDATSDLFESFKLHGVNTGSSWYMSQTSVGQDSGIILTITNAGQIQYTSTNVSGFSSGTMRFRAITTLASF